MQVGEDADLAGLDYVLAKTREVAGAGAAGVDGGGDARAAAEILRVDAERRSTPVDVRVQIDQSRRDDGAGYVANVGAGRGLQPRSDARDLALREGDIGDGVELLRRVDHAAAPKDEVVSHSGALLVWGRGGVHQGTGHGRSGGRIAS